MLIGLRLHNIALIESLELDFERGFSVFTGETGAGKSVFLFAIDSLLGGGGNSANSRLMRTGSHHSQIEGIFSIDSSVKKWLEDNFFETLDNELIVSRDWKVRDGRILSRIRLNGEIISKKDILSLRPKLIDLTQQGQSHKLTSSTEQLKLLDRFGSFAIEEALALVKQSWRTWNLIKLKFEKVKKEYEFNQSELIATQNFLEDIENANIDDPLEEKLLKEVQDRLLYGVKLQDSLGLIFSKLKETSDDFPSARDNFLEAIQELKKSVQLDASLSSQLEILFDSYSKLEEFLKSLEDYQNVLESEPDQLDSIQNRLAEINRVKSRYKLDLQGLLERRDNAISLLDKNSQSFLNEIAYEEKLARKELGKCNANLTKVRKKYAKDLEHTLTKYLKPLGLKNIKFEVFFNSSSPSETGEDLVEFMFSANEGEPLAPLARVASGGEMSRFLLALTSVFSEVTGSATLIFDEIDSGVSGSVSEAIAKLMKDLSLNKQVFCITHQPLVAAAGDHHFSVSKKVYDGMTVSKVHLLKDFVDRQSELVKLTGGDFEKASIYAASLLENKAA